MEKEHDFWKEPAGERLAGYCGLLIGILLLFCTISTIIYYCNRFEPVACENPWINNDPSRPVTDIKELDYERRLIIYRDEESRRQIRKFEWNLDSCMHETSANYYEDYYEDVYEYFHD